MPLEVVLTEVAWRVEFLPRDAMLARYMPSSCLCVCLYVWNGFQILCTGRLYQVLPKGWQITPERGVVWLMWPIFAFTVVDLEKLCHGTPLFGIHNKTRHTPNGRKRRAVSLQQLSFLFRRRHEIAISIHKQITRSLPTAGRFDWRYRSTSI